MYLKGQKEPKMTKKLFTLFLSVVVLCCFTNTFDASAGQLMSKTKVSEKELEKEKKKTLADKEKSSKIMEACINGNNISAALRSVCSNAQSHASMTIRLIEQAIKLHKKEGSENIIRLFTDHTRVIKSLDTTANRLMISWEKHQAKQAVFDWHVMVMDQIRFCLKRDKTLLNKLYGLHAEVSEEIRK